MRIRPRRTLEAIDARLARASTPRHRAVLENFREHWRRELAGDVDGVMDLLVEEPHYRFLGAFRERFPDTPTELIGADAVRRFYEGHARSQTVAEMVFDGIVVDDRGTAAWGRSHVVAPGSVLVGEMPDPAATYLVTTDVALFWPYDDRALLEGEIVFFGFAGTGRDPAPRAGGCRHT